MAVVDIAGDALLVDQDLGGHAAELEEVDLLAVELEDACLRVGQADKGQRLLLEVSGEGFGVFGADHDDFDIAGKELRVVLAQLRHVRAAEGSTKGAVEDQEDVLAAAEVLQADRIAVVVGQAEVGGCLVKGYTCQIAAPAMAVRW